MLSLPWLHVDGIWIVDESGNRVALRGIAAIYNCYTYNLPGILAIWRQRLPWMKEQGYNIVRMYLYKFHETYHRLDWLDAVIDLFEEYGIYVVITAGYGNDLGLYYADGSWINGWIAIAQRYKDRSVVAAYELANEGLVGFDANGDHIPTRQAFIDCINAIRQYDSNHILIIYEPVRNWRRYELALQNPTTIWLRQYATWFPDTLPSDSNIAFKFGNHWLVLRDYALTGGSPTHPAYLYYKDKFSMALSWAGDYVYCLIKYRELMNRSVLNFEFGHYDDTPAHANYAGVKDHIRLCEEQCIPWNFHWFEQYMPRNPNWKEYLGTLCGKYDSLYFGTPAPFTPLPFNLMDYATPTGPQVGYSAFGPGIANIIRGNEALILTRQCSVRVRSFSPGYPDERKLTNFIGDEIVTTLEGQTVTIQGIPDVWLIINPFSTSLKTLSVKSTPIVGVPITIDGQSIKAPSSIQLPEGSYLISVPDIVEVP